MKTINCEYCGEPVYVIKSVAGRKIIVNPKPVEFAMINTHGDAYQMYVLPSGYKVYGRPLKKSDTKVSHGYIEHRSTCANQKPFERKRSVKREVNNK